jgi:hypothetical protein
MHAIYNASSVLAANTDTKLAAAKFPQLGKALRGTDEETLALRIQQTMDAGYGLSCIIAKAVTESKRDALARARENHEGQTLFMQTLAQELQSLRIVVGLLECAVARSAVVAARLNIAPPTGGES